MAMLTEAYGSPLPVQAATTFENPIIPGFHPDPTICRVGRDFYLATSSFEYFPGVPIFHSRDLVNWKKIGHALSRRSQLDLAGIHSSGGIYAPTLRHHAGRFYLVTSLIGGRGNFYVTADNPEGPWSEPVWLDDHGIDPSLLFDDGVVYYTRNGEGPDRDHPLICMAELDLERGCLVAPPKPIWAGLGGIWPEGSHLYRRGQFYYLMHAEGGTAYDHSEVVARSKSPWGPFQPALDNPILSHRARRGHEIQATGHADLVDLEDGTTWAVFLGVRPHNGRHHLLGRETFLSPVTWSRDGWPTIGRDGRVELRMSAPSSLPPAPVGRPASRDDFEGGSLSIDYNFVRNPDESSWSLEERPGHLRLWGGPCTLDEAGAPAAVLRRQCHFRVQVRTRLEFDPRDLDEAGLVVRANENFYYSLSVRRDSAGQRHVGLIARVRGQTRCLGRKDLPPGPVLLEVSSDAKHYELAVVDSTGARQVLGERPTRSLSAESIQAYGQTYFTGVYVGMYATGRGKRSQSPADFDFFEYVGQPGPM